MVEADVLYGSMSSGRGNRFQRGHNGRGYSRSYRGGQSRPYRGNQSMKGRNPPDMYGNTSKCAVCGSVNHWAKNCPDVAKKDSSTLHCEHSKCEKQEKKETLNVINIIMQSNSWFSIRTLFLLCPLSSNAVVCFLFPIHYLSCSIICSV